MKLPPMIVVASFSAAAISGLVTLASCVACWKASLCACAYSTDWENCGLMSTPQASPGYVQEWSEETGLDSVLSIDTSCTDCGSCGRGGAIVTATRPGMAPDRFMSTRRGEWPVD